jgi:transposase
VAALDFKISHLVATVIDACGNPENRGRGHPPADKGYDAAHNRTLCRQFDADPCSHKRGQPRGSGLGKRRWPVERSLAWVLENRRLALRYNRRGFVIQLLLQSACIFLVAGRLAREF